jgi:hypothetical protein
MSTENFSCFVPFAFNGKEHTELLIQPVDNIILAEDKRVRGSLTMFLPGSCEVTSASRQMASQFMRLVMKSQECCYQEERPLQ